MHLSPRPPQDDEFYMQATTGADAAGGGTAEAVVLDGPDAARFGAQSSYYDPMDDIFGSDPGSPAGAVAGDATTTTSAEEHGTGELTADLRRLRAQHNKEGYREGIMAGKAGSIQAGFDEGYSIGANIGLKAGQLLGLLEGIAAALGSVPFSREASTAYELYATAKTELGSTAAHFGEAYWQADGQWKYDVPSAASLDGGKSDAVMATPEAVADAHPLIVKWTAVVDEAVRRYNLNLELPSLRSNDLGQLEDTAETRPIKLEQQSRQAMDW